jgi:hypothetical protein
MRGSAVSSSIMTTPGLTRLLNVDGNPDHNRRDDGDPETDYR